MRARTLEHCLRVPHGARPHLGLRFARVAGREASSKLEIDQDIAVEAAPGPDAVVVDHVQLLRREPVLHQDVKLPDEQQLRGNPEERSGFTRQRQLGGYPFPDRGCLHSHSSDEQEEQSHEKAMMPGHGDHGERGSDGRLPFADKTEAEDAEKRRKQKRHGKECVAEAGTAEKQQRIEKAKTPSVNGKRWWK
ncbi:hypothetical protein CAUPRSCDRAFT_12833 [Caulochytrium protostelioides]|uniref:Uncharacterized protein n=1 Tax=Caulochytrium protostelioides TaxID=1555241 RepID=A0A4P9WST8_9FUNG|nr:hypothetical protein CAUPRSCDRAFT_12833 [Caulochytrium protostelioides]